MPRYEMHQCSTFKAEILRQFRGHFDPCVGSFRAVELKYALGFLKALPGRHVLLVSGQDEWAPSAGVDTGEGVVAAV